MGGAPPGPGRRGRVRSRCSPSADDLTVGEVRSSRLISTLNGSRDPMATRISVAPRAGPRSSRALRVPHRGCPSRRRGLGSARDRRRPSKLIRSSAGSRSTSSWAAGLLPNMVARTVFVAWAQGRARRPRGAPDPAARRTSAVGLRSARPGASLEDHGGSPRTPIQHRAPSDGSARSCAGSAKRRRSSAVGSSPRLALRLGSWRSPRSSTGPSSPIAGVAAARAA